VVVYDAHPPEKGLHVHFYDRRGAEFAEEPLRGVIRTVTLWPVLTTRWSRSAMLGRRTRGGPTVATREDLRARLVPGIARLARARDFRAPSND